MKMLKPKFINITLATILLFTFNPFSNAQDPLPYSDASNEGNWVLNKDVSDEFDATEVDEDKWYIVGKFMDGKPIYKDPDNPNRKVWIGRAPSQFSGRNYRLNDGKLMLETRWEPDFPFDDGYDEYGGTKYYFENITTPCFIGRSMFKYGYMEIRCKAADAEITSSFWATGNNTELDMFEFFGDHRQQNKLAKDRELWWSIHDWSPGMGGASVYTEHHDLGFRVADDFHVYGFEWNEAGIKYYIDGELYIEASAEEIDAYAVSKGFEKGYVITKEIKIWLDQETFPWHGVPDSKDDLTLNGTADQKAKGIMDFEIDYVRVWQEGEPLAVDTNLLDDDFFGFESKIEIDGQEKDWFIPAESKDNFSINDEKPAQGSQSLKFVQSGTLDANKVCFAPFKSTEITSGEYTYTMKVWLEESSALNNLRVIFENPWTELHFDMTKVETGKWITLSQDFTRDEASGDTDRPRILVKPDDTSNGSTTLYIDDLAVVKKLETRMGKTTSLESKIYPNPARHELFVSASEAKSIRITNLCGVEMLQMHKNAEPFRVSLANIPSGIYLLSVESDKGISTQKIQIIN